MATLEDRITALEEEITEYRVLLKDAPAGDKIAYANLITARGNNLNALLQQQQQLQQLQQQAQVGGGGQGQLTQAQGNVNFVMREEDVEKLAQRLKAHNEKLSSYSDSELARMVELQQSVPLISINANDSESPVLDYQLAASQNEHELIVLLTPALNMLCHEANLLFVNSEEWKWMRTILEHPDNYQKPDGLSCQKGLYKSKDPHRPNLNPLREENQTTYLFGLGIWEIRDMYKIWEFKTKISPADRGTAYSYALHLSRDDALNTYHVILCDIKCFYIIEARGGVITKRTGGDWVTAGSRKALLDTLRWQNPWERLLAALCTRHSVTVEGYLGRGLCGRCFKVITSDGSERAMKIVLTLGDDNEWKRSSTLSEFECLIRLVDNEYVVKAEAQSLWVVDDGECELGVGYLMREVGTPISRAECRNPDALLKLMTSLHTLHVEGHHHGDPRFQNAIMVSGRVVWIDFMGSHCRGILSLMRADIKLLIKSIFDEINASELLSAIEAYDASVENLLAVYDVLVRYYSL